MTAYIAALVATMIATAVMRLAGGLANETTVALLYVLLVLTVAVLSDSGPAIATALVAAAAYNYFFLQPVGTFTIADTRNWVALAVMLAVGIAVGELSRHVRRRASEADASRRRAESLLSQLEDAFEREAASEAARRGERLKALLLGGVTHDLRTPLTAIKAAVTTLIADGDRRGGLDAAARNELLDVVDEETDRLDRLVEELLATARLASSRWPLTMTWVSLDDVLRAAVRRVEPRLRGHRLNVDCRVELPAVHVDARAIEEAVYLVLENAAKYAPPGSAITLGAEMAGPAVQVTVTDEGPGVDSGERAQIFETFTRGAASAGTPGLGMGLAIVRGLLEAHRGSVGVETSPSGRGTRFVLRFPVGDDEAR